jgi:hypothetical protein
MDEWTTVIRVADWTGHVAGILAVLITPERRVMADAARVQWASTFLLDRYVAVPVSDFEILGVVDNASSRLADTVGRVDRMGGQLITIWTVGFTFIGSHIVGNEV